MRLNYIYYVPTIIIHIHIFWHYSGETKKKKNKRAVKVVLKEWENDIGKST